MSRLRIKLTVLFGAVLLVMALVADHLACDTLRGALGTKLERRGLAIARDLAAMSHYSFPGGDQDALRRLAARVKTHDPDTRYVLITDGHGRVVANTFGDRIPRGLLEANRLEGAQQWRTRRFQTDEGMVRDIAVAVPGRGTGAVRVGMSDRSLEAALTRYSWMLGLAVAFVLLAGLAVSYGLAGYIARPVTRLLEAARKVERGDLAERVPAPGRDEVGQLAVAFNKMTAALAEKEAMRQALLEKMITGQEEERKRVARDLHDDLAQRLAFVLVRLEELDGRLGPHERESRELLGQVREAVGTSLAETRRLMTDLRPSVLDDLGLVPALRSYAASHLEAHGCRAVVQASGVPESLPPVVETAVFRIVQEAINNIARHAGARNVRIALQGSAEGLSGEVVDDGCGFRRGALVGAAVLAEPVRSPEAGLPGLGLQGMRERATLLGGSLEVREAAGGGTEVVFGVPLGTGRKA